MARCVKRLAGGRFRWGTGTDGKLPLQKPVSQVRILPGALIFPQLIDTLGDYPLRLGPTRGRCLVGEPMTRGGVHWSPTASLAAASRRTATSSRSVGKSPA